MPPGAILDASCFNSKTSMSAGIQEALDALPPAGGCVMIPPGIMTIHRPIIMKPGAKLSGAGCASILKKDAAFLVNITQDAQTGQNYIEVDEINPIRIGASIAVGDINTRATISTILIVTNIAGKRIYFHQGLWPGKSVLPCNLTVAQGACAINLFPLVIPAKNTVIMDLEFDGNIDEQMLDNPKAFRASRDQLGAGLYPAQGTIERCRIHNCTYGIHVSVATGIELQNCDIYCNSGDGVHLGGGPHSKITNNRIYENGSAGIYFCYSNRKIIITGNEIMRNQFGISGLDVGNPERDTTADRSSIISRNLIYENQCAGIYNWGRIGPQDFVITDNILHNNWQGHEWRGLPQAGLVLKGSQRCVIAGNRSYDDRETYPRFVLRQPAAPGTNAIFIGLADQNIHSEPYLLPNDRLRIGTETGRYAVVSYTNGMAALDRPLPGPEPAGTPVARLAAQDWGIVVLGQESRDNLISGNVCVGNRLGGLLIEQATDQVVGPNVGLVVAK